MNSASTRVFCQHFSEKHFFKFVFFTFVLYNGQYEVSTPVPFAVVNITRKLSYRKDDRAMRTMYMGALKIFGSPRQRQRLLFPKFLMGFCSD